MPPPTPDTRDQSARRPAAWRWARLVLLIMAPAAIIAAVVAWRSHDANGPTLWQQVFGPEPDDLPLPFPAPMRSFDDHIAALDRAITTHRDRAAREPTDWLSPGAEAATWLDRAAMTGRWQDYAAAESALALAMRRAPPSAAPHPLAARLAMALHRNAEVEPALVAARVDLEFVKPGPQADAMLLRGDIALYRGQWRDADRLYQQSDQTWPNDSAAFRRAFVTERTAEPDAAIAAWMDVARRSARPSRPLLATIALRIGGIELARGEWEEAARWHARAERYLPGDWHVAARRLQDRALGGDLSGAITAMARLAAQHDLPELWDALSAWQRANGNSAGANAASARAAAGWARFAARFPLATAGHQAEHALIVGDSAAALRFARANHDNRPYGDAVALLAAALIADGKAADAARLVRQTMASGWRSAELDRLAFEAALLSGDSAAAELARDAAEARNGRAFDQRARLIRFGLH